VTRLSGGHDLFTPSSQGQHSAPADHPSMSDSDRTDQPDQARAADAPAAPPYAPPPVPAYAAQDQPPATEPRPRFRDRVLGMRGVIAVALASVVLGGVGGTVLGATTHGDDWFGHGGPGAFPAGGPGRPGQSGQGVQPGQPPIPQPGS
jgi:hypothetical protein